MKDTLWKNTLLLVIGFLLICMVGIIVEAQFKLFRRSYDNFILDNRNHYLSCEDLPTMAEVERIVEQHRDAIQQMQEIAPGFVEVEIDTSNCAGEADLLISYGTHEQRIAIEKIINGDTFFGIPYRLQNR